VPEEPAYPSRSLLHRGPPRPDRGASKAREKWCRVAQIISRPGASGQVNFQVKGPYTIPMAIRREGTQLGEAEKAWLFFTHPYSVFDPEGAFFNVTPQSGILSSTLVRRGREGVTLFDEVGTGVRERVSATYQAALGVMRHRTMKPEGDRTPPRELARGFLKTDLRLLRVFRILTLLLKSQSPRLLFKELESLLSDPTVISFFGEEFNSRELALIRREASLRGDPHEHLEELGFAISPDDFMSSDQLRDGNGVQVVAQLKKRWDDFRSRSGKALENIESERAAVEATIESARRKLELEITRRESMKGLGRYISGRLFSLDGAHAKLAALEARAKELESAHVNMPGYREIIAFSERLKGFNEICQGVARLATNVFDHNVDLNTIKSMEELASSIEQSDAEQRRLDLRRYTMQLRAKIAPRLMQAFSISAYIMRRPDALVGPQSTHNMRRVNRMAEKLIEYFRALPYEQGKNLGDAFDEGWGQVRLLEARL
jgi:hypothetical protein